MSVQLVFSEALITLALFAFGVIGYSLSKRVKTYMKNRVYKHTKKSENVQVLEETSTASQSSSTTSAEPQRLTKTITTQAKNAEARRRAKRQVRKEVAQMVVSTPLLGNCATDEDMEGHPVPEIPRSQQATEDGVESPSPDQTSEQVTEELSVEPNTQPPLEQPPSKEDRNESGTQDEVTTEPGTQDEAEAESSEHFQQDDDEADSSHGSGVGERAQVDAEVENDVLAYEPSVFSNDDGMDFDIPPTPPNEEAMMYPLDGGVFHNVVSVPSYTNGQQIYEPVLSPPGQQLYTDGQQVFMLACVEANPDTSCFGQLPNVYHDGSCGTLNYGDSNTLDYGDSNFGSSTFGNQKDDDDLWNVSWDDLLSQVYTPETAQ